MLDQLVRGGTIGWLLLGIALLAPVLGLAFVHWSHKREQALHAREKRQLREANERAKRSQDK